MVVFSCDGCGEVLRKNQVDAHAARCRNCASVSCADCLQIFVGDDYRAHTSCLTEVERYETKGKVTKNSKVSPQQQWMNLLASSVASCPAHLKQYLQTMADLDNVPRKEKQFRNFAKNSLHIHARESDRMLDEIWKFLMGVKAEHATIRTDESSTSKTEEIQNHAIDKGAFADVGRESPAVDSRISATTQKVDDSVDDNLSAKVVKRAMERVLKESEGNALALKKLRKTLRRELGVSKNGKHKLKQLIKSSLSKKITLDDKVVRLHVS